MRQVGRPVPRLEDARLLVGHGRYTDDVAQAEHAAAFAVFVRAPHAHARLLAIETMAAAAMPGVLSVLTAAEYDADGNRPIRHAANPPDATVPTQPWFVAAPDCFLHEAPQPPIIARHVRHLGEIVAMVVAESLAAGRDAAERVTVEYEPLPALRTADEALRADSAQLGESPRHNLVLDTCLGDPTGTAAACAAAHLVVAHVFANQRLANCQMEPRAALAFIAGAMNAGGRVTLVAGSQGVVRQRVTLAECLNLPVAQVRVISPDVGGGFGPRTPLNPEPVLVAWAARRLGRPVRWTSDRSEAFLTDYQARDLTTTASLAFDEEGRILALKVDLLANLGAYPVSFAPLANGSRIVSTVYAVPMAAISVRGVLTNSTPTAPYRGAGRPEATLVIERLLDMAAGKLDLDRLVLRRRNLISHAALPYRTPGGLTYDSGDFLRNMNQAAELANWSGFPARRARSSAAGRLRGIGLANYIESPVGAPRERFSLIIHPDHAEIIAGTQSSGQGHETVFAQIVAEQLDIPLDRIRLRTGDTDHVQVGGGSHSDRSARLGATLLARACTALRRTIREASILLPSQSEDPFVIAQALADGRLPTQFGASLSATEEISERIPAFPTGCAVCELEVDPETGAVVILAYSSVDDVGQPINPMIVEGQVHGGIVQGIGQALHEAIAVDASGQLLTGSLQDYALTRADRVPSFALALTEDPTSGNPLRIKGGGEGGITPATASVMNALADALGGRDIEMPATPERVWRAVMAG